jgi:hypothetical protein
MEDDSPSNWDFQKLSDFISSIRNLFPSRYVFEELESNPLTSKSIEKLANKGWKVYFDERFTGLCCPFTKSIRLRNYKPYFRDRILCHELVHAHYGKIISDGFEARTTEESRNNNAIAEWYARQVRANNYSLASIWKNFGISPRVYDLPSLLATPQLIRPQLLFPSFYEAYNFTLMD